METNFVFEKSATAAAPRDPACFDTKLASTGGPAPRDPTTLAVRWIGVSNFELSYKGKIILLDAFFDRGEEWPPLGFHAADVVKADVILIGHAHFDHMSDAASVGLRTGALLVGAPITADKLKTQSVPDAQIRSVTGKGGELLKFGDFTVQPILALHGRPDKHIAEVMQHALDELTPKPSDAEKVEEKTIMDRGTFDPRVITEGTIAYLITLDDGFRIMYRDSGGRVTDDEREAMRDLPGVDLALAAVSADFLNPPTQDQALEYMRLYRPDVFIPAHHDAPVSGHAPLWRATEPIFQALKDANPRLVTISREYREPVCFDTGINVAHGRQP
ncbi:MBL fold metallo-hydrolase [Bradyrhizobium sp.]|uniref:MBL fold metallo-hydrolase n=1 Tax=Bradyrhizobium sp. TaxID=376 RepID=UPI003C68AA7B